MSKLIGGKVDKRMFRPRDLFNHMTDEDFMFIHEAGQLTSLCMALSIDLQSKKYEKE